MGTAIVIGAFGLLLALLAMVVVRQQIRLRQLHSLLETLFQSEARQLPLEKFWAVPATVTAGGERFLGKFHYLNRRLNELTEALDKVPVGTILVDHMGRVHHINSTALQMLRQPNVQPGVHLLEVCRSNQVQVLLERLGRTKEQSASVEVRSDAAPQSVLRVTGFRLESEQDAEVQPSPTCCYLLVLEDVTNIEQWEGLQRQLMASISHELKTPLTSIRGYAETLLEGAIDDRDNARRFLEVIVRQSDRMLELITAILRLSQLEQEAADGRIEMHRMEVQELFANAMAACRYEAEEKSVELKAECPAGLLIRGNARLLQQALVNLVSNAIKYSPSGSQVLLAARRVDRQVEISVTDRGPGIDPRYVDRLFEPFYRVPQSEGQKPQGFGLGLALVRRIAAAHGGSVGVDTAPGRGSRFYFRIPT